MSLFRTKVEQRKLEDIGTWMLAGKRPEVPEVLRGVFFMDGNPLPEDCGTFQGLDWNAETRTVAVPMFGHLQWTYEDSSRGRRLLFGAKFFRNTLEFRFEDDSLREARITPIFFGFFRMPWWLTEYTLTRVEDDTNGDTWYRRNSRLFRSRPFGGYTLRRILR